MSANDLFEADCKAAKHIIIHDDNIEFLIFRNIVDQAEGELITSLIFAWSWRDQLRRYAHHSKTLRRPGFSYSQFLPPLDMKVIVYPIDDLSIDEAKNIAESYIKEEI